MWPRFFWFVNVFGEVTGVGENEERTERRPANAPLVEVKGSEMQLISSESWARRCDSKSRGSVYHSVFGICCHFCRFYVLPFWPIHIVKQE